MPRQVCTTNGHPLLFFGGIACNPELLRAGSFRDPEGPMPRGARTGLRVRKIRGSKRTDAMEMEYEIRHRLPGRLRLRLAALACDEYRRGVRETLLSEKRIKAVDIAVVARSITITYQPGSLTLDEILSLLDPERRIAGTAPEESAPVEAPAVEARVPEAEPERVEPESVAGVVEASVVEDRDAVATFPPHTEPPAKPARKKSAPQVAGKKKAAAGKGTGQVLADRGKGKPAQKEVKPKAAAKSTKGKSRNT